MTTGAVFQNGVILNQLPPKGLTRVCAMCAICTMCHSVESLNYEFHMNSISQIVCYF